MSDGAILIFGARGTIGNYLSGEFRRIGYETVGITSATDYPDELLSNFDELRTLDYTMPEEEIQKFISAMCLEFHVQAIVITIGKMQNLHKISQIKQRDLLDYLTSNLVTPISIANACWQHFEGRVQQPKVFLFSGGGGTSANTSTMAYGVAKTALVRYVEAMGLERSQHGGPEVIGISPGAILSDMTRRQLETKMPVEHHPYIEKLNRQLAESDGNLQRVFGFILGCIHGAFKVPLAGRLVSTNWDDWESWRLDDANVHPDFGKLRRKDG